MLHFDNYRVGLVFNLLIMGLECSFGKSKIASYLLILWTRGIEEKVVHLVAAAMLSFIFFFFDGIDRVILCYKIYLRLSSSLVLPSEFTRIVSRRGTLVYWKH